MMFPRPGLAGSSVPENLKLLSKNVKNVISSNYSYGREKQNIQGTVLREFVITVFLP
jgi:hypothetical protein